MENGKEVLARIPNPIAGHSQLCVASEVATLDFLRNVLDIPVPRVLAWSSPAIQPNLVGADYILMERVKGRQLSEVWDGMSETQRFGLVKALVEIEAKLANAKLSKHGSLYYKDTYAGERSNTGLDELPVSNPAAAKFTIGPTTERSFWENETQGLDIDRGPWETAQQYLSAVAEREIALVRNQASQNDLSVSAKTPAAREEHIRLLEMFQSVLPFILPRKEEVSGLVMLHHDLYENNIFVDSTDPTKITSIIDWQEAYSSPLFLQARFASIFDCDDPYPWGAVKPELPEDFDTLSEAEQDMARDQLDRIRLKKFYEMASRKFNPLLIKTMDSMRNNDDPTNFIFHVVGRSSLDGPLPLKELLMQIHEKWHLIAKKQGLEIPCPISFSKEEIEQGRQQVEAWADVFAQFHSLKTQLLGKDGLVSHEEYEEAMRRWEDNRADFEALRERLDKVVLGA